MKLNRRTFLGVSAGGVAALGLRIPFARAAVPPKLNILVIALDDMSSEESGALTYLNSQPFGQWATFPNFVLNNPLCGPSRATTLTGQASHHHGVAYNTETNDLNDANVLPLWLQQAGYRTGLVGKYLNGYPFTTLRPQPYVPRGWNGWNAYVSGQQYLDYTLRNGKGVDTHYPPSDANYSTDFFTQRAIAFLDKPSTAPFFLTVCYNAPHKPCTPANRHLNDFSNLAPLRPPSYNNVTGKPAWMQSLPPTCAASASTGSSNASRTPTPTPSPPDGARIAVFYTKIHARLLRPLIAAADQPPALSSFAAPSPPSTRPSPTTPKTRASARPRETCRNAQSPGPREGLELRTRALSSSTRRNRTSRVGSRPWQANAAAASIYSQRKPWDSPSTAPRRPSPVDGWHTAG